MLSKFLDPKNDVAFRKIFGTEKNKDILIHFLNDMITFKGEGHGQITAVTFLKTVQDPDTATKKSSIVDILCTDQRGNQYIVEMQVAKEKGFAKRAQYYASKAYVSQAHAGGEYVQLKEIVFLAITDFVMFPEKKGYKSDHVILDRDSHENDLKDFSFTFVELPKFSKAIDQLIDVTDKWAYFFKHAEETDEDDLQRIIAGEAALERAFEELNRFHWSNEELRSYEQAEKYENAYRASLAQKFDEGERLGLEKGVREGLRQVARNCLAQGMGVEAILRLTGLDVEEIEALKAEPISRE
jgi:predicted transposase/invertase (TIGR01784 family)